jgi:hypothetical protein
MNAQETNQSSKPYRFLRIICGVAGFLIAWIALIPVAIYSVNLTSKLVIGGSVELIVIAGISIALSRWFPKSKPFITPFSITLLATLFLIFSATAINWELRNWRLSHGATLGLTLRSTRTPPALPSALFQLLASSAPFSASVQAGPVSFIR